MLALGLTPIFGVMHLVNFRARRADHGLLVRRVRTGIPWLGVGVMIVAIVASVLTAVAIEFLAFRWVRGESEFTMLLTSFGVHFVVAALFVMYVSPRLQNIPKPEWIFETVRIGGLPFEVFDLVTIGVTLVTLVATERVLRRTMFGIALRAAAEDFDAARIMGVRSNLAIRGAFALSGVLAGVAGVFWLMRTGTASPTVGLTPLLFGVIAAIVGGQCLGWGDPGRSGPSG